LKTPAPQQGLLAALARAIGAALLLTGLASPAGALPDDQDQPIHITADQALRDENRGHTVYSGNVRLVQGSMELDADRLTIWHTSENADRFVAKGKPARMRQRPEVDQELVHAHADVITYWHKQQRVNLSSNARIEQRGDVVTGDLIVYLIEQQVIKAESSQRQSTDRVHVVIQPSTQQGESRSATTTTSEEVDTPAEVTAPADTAAQSTEAAAAAAAAEPTVQDSENGEPSGATESD